MSTFTVYNPATGAAIKDVPINTNEQVEAKINAGFEAFLDWRDTTAYERAELLHKWADAIMAEKSSIARTMTEENGKPLTESLGEVNYAVSYIRWYAEEAKRLYGRTIPAGSRDKRLLVTQQGIGLVAAITPWNFPAAMMTRKAAPAIAAGCAFIVKPAEETPLTTIRLIELAHQAGFPFNLIQCVNGDGPRIGEIFTSHARIRKITFTGSTHVGKLLMKNSADSVKHITMELGGHAPFIICEDADMDLVIPQAIASKFRNAGQTCVCANRFIVHASRYDEFCERFTEEAAKLNLGNGLESDTDIGPVINQKGYGKIMDQIEDAVTKGANVLLGGSGIADFDKETFFVRPTILGDVTLEMDIMHEETFGPVAPVYRYYDLDDAIAIANGTPYGLAAYFFTEDYKRALKLHRALDFGIVGWNDGLPSAAQVPFGGMKESGIGREGGVEGIEAYLETKYLSIGGLTE